VNLEGCIMQQSLLLARQSLTHGYNGNSNLRKICTTQYEENPKPYPIKGVEKSATAAVQVTCMHYGAFLVTAAHQITLTLLQLESTELQSLKHHGIWIAPAATVVLLSIWLIGTCCQQPSRHIRRAARRSLQQKRMAASKGVVVGATRGI